MRLALALWFALGGCAEEDSTAPPAAELDATVATPVVRPSLILTEVAAAGHPDWFEIVNASDQPVLLSDFVFTDARGKLEDAARFPAVTLAPGGYHVQTVTKAKQGFKLGGDEELWIHRASDGQLVDGVDWAAGAAPRSGSFARRGGLTGEFATVHAPTRGGPNP